MGIFDFVVGSKENLYFPGCFTSSFPETRDKIENYKKILKKLKIDFSMLKDKDFICCGGILDEGGYEKQLRKTAKSNLAFFKEKAVKKIITNCAQCYKIFSSDYKTIIPNWDIESEFIANTILKRLIEDPNLIRSYTAESICYYDSCYLARYSNIIKEPREILKILGYKIIELPYNKEETLCCGSCGLVDITDEELSEDMCFNFIKMLKRRNIHKLVTADIRAYYHLKRNLGILNITDIEVLEFSDIICAGLGIKPE